VANRLVVPSLSSDDIPKFATGELTLDLLTKRFIHNHLDYQYVLLASSDEAYETERQARRGMVFGDKPFLNPLAD
jgi:hypothetical protein